MKRYTMYVCEKCKKESRNIEEIQMCEGAHIGLTTLVEVYEYNMLQKEVEWRSSMLSSRRNEETIAAQDKAIDDIIRYEKEHNMVVEG